MGVEPLPRHMALRSPTFTHGTLPLAVIAQICGWTTKSAWELHRMCFKNQPFARDLVILCDTVSLSLFFFFFFSCPASYPTVTVTGLSLCLILLLHPLPHLSHHHFVPLPFNPLANLALSGELHGNYSVDYNRHLRQLQFWHQNNGPYSQVAQNI